MNSITDTVYSEGLPDAPSQKSGQRVIKNESSYSEGIEIPILKRLLFLIKTK